MNIEEIAKAAIAALQRASIEELEAKCKEFGHVPVRRQHHSWQSAVYFYDMSLMEEAATCYKDWRKK